MYGEGFHEDENGDFGGISAQVKIYIYIFIDDCSNGILFPRD